jgi:hypothetical protein
MTNIAFEPKFSLGQVVLSLAAVEKLVVEDVKAALKRHEVGDWGDLNLSQTELRDEAFAFGGELHSRFHDRNNTEFFIVTRCDRSQTMVFLREG